MDARLPNESKAPTLTRFSTTFLLTLVLKRKSLNDLNLPFDFLLFRYDFNSLFLAFAATCGIASRPNKISEP